VDREAHLPAMREFTVAELVGKVDIGDARPQRRDAADKGQFLATEREVVRVDAEPVDEAEIIGGRDREGADNGGEIALDAGVLQHVLLAEDAPALADEHLGLAAAIGKQAVGEAIDDTDAIVDAITAGVAVLVEKVEVVEFEVEAVLVGNAPCVEI